MQAVASLLTPGLSVADVGCDHAHVSIYLIENGLAASVIAMDVGEGPLNTARENIRQQGLSDVIETRLSDGGRELRVGEVQAAIIAGMGGMLMERILNESMEVFMAMEELILAPQSDLSHFRRYITSIGMKIIDEDMVQEGGIFYPVIKAVPVKNSGGGKSEPDELTDIEAAFGPVLLGKKHKVLLEYLNWNRRLKVNVRKILEESDESERAAERLKTFIQDIEMIDEALGRY